MDKYRETFETWNKVASLYQEKFMDLDLYNETYDYLCSLLSKPGAKILEPGCGPGNISRYFLSRRPDFDIHGIDIAPNMIELARKNNPGATYSVMDCRDLHQLKPGYAAIVSGFCLPYLSETDTAKLITDSYRLLDDGGLLYLSFVEGNHDRSGFQSAGTGDRTYFYYQRKERIIELLEQKHFEILKVFTVEYLGNTAKPEEHIILLGRKVG